MPEPTEQGETPVTTPAPVAGVTPAAEDQLPEGVRAVLAKERTAREEAEREKRKAEKRAADAEADLQRRQDAELSESERLKKDNARLTAELAEGQNALRDERIRAALERAAVKANFRDPDDAVIRLTTLVELDESGAPKNIDALVKKLADEKDYLLVAAATPRPGNGPSPRPAGEMGRDGKVKQAQKELADSDKYRPL